MKELRWVLAFNVFVLVLAAYQLLELIVLLNDGDTERLLEPELRDITYSGPNHEVPDRPLLIPKIIHQTYKTAEIPEKWKGIRETCIEKHPDYEYKFWTDAQARAFIEENYDWFLPTYDSYPFPIQRVDAVRYFLLYHFGGVYVDLDVGCDFRMDPLLTVAAWARKTEPTGVSNDVMGAMAGHPFFQHVILNLEAYNKNWWISYLSVMYSTGPLFLSVLLKKFYWKGTPHSDLARVRLLYPPDRKLHTRWFFFDRPGSSWHMSDARFLLQLGDHWVLAVMVGVALYLGLLYLQVRACQWLVRHGVLRSLQRRLAQARYSVLVRRKHDSKV